MLKTEREKRICLEYGAYDKFGRVHCSECPLKKSKHADDFRCKANSHWDYSKKEWVYDERTEHGRMD